MESTPSGGTANSSSDFVRFPSARHRSIAMLTTVRPPGSQIIQVRGTDADAASFPWTRLTRRRMLENPTDETIVRWGNDGDSFVVLEVRFPDSTTIQSPH